MVQLVGVQLKLRLRLQNHVVLVQLRVHRIDLPLAERVVERIVDRRRRHAQARSSRPVDHQRHRQTAHLLVGRNIFELRQLLQPGDKAIGPVIQFVLVRVLQRVLVLRPAHPVIDRDVLHRLHEELNALHILQLRLQPAHHVRRAQVALLQRLQVDRHSSAVHRRVRAVRADE